MEDEKNLVVKNNELQGLENIGLNRNSKCNIFTNIEDKKLIFNLENNVDELLNDCGDELIKVKYVLIKNYEKEMKEPVIDEETGEVLKDKEYTMSCVLVDENGKSYATGSKMFTIQMMKYIEMFGLPEEGITIKITKTKFKDTGNKKLGFELV